MTARGAAAVCRAAAALAAFATLSLVGACAPMVVAEPARLEAAAPTARPEIVVRDAVEFRLPTGYRRTIPAGSRWRLAGRLPQGDVYRPVGIAFSIEGRQVHEAWLVVSPAPALLGFYLPGETNWSALTAPLQLTLGDSP